MDEGFVYLIVEYDTIELDSSKCKIGVTKEINGRVKALSTGNAHELHVVTLYKTKYPYKIEKFLHRKFANKRLNLEWFLLTDEDMITFKSECEKYEKIIEDLQDNFFYR
jgi:hypothetical protein